MPGEVRADSEDELVLDEASAAGTGAAPVPCKHRRYQEEVESSRVGFSYRLEHNRISRPRPPSDSGPSGRPESDLKWK